jgi:hypothetical protein
LQGLSAYATRCQTTNQKVAGSSPAERAPKTPAKQRSEDLLKMRLIGKT